MGRTKLFCKGICAKILALAISAVLLMTTVVAVRPAMVGASSVLEENDGKYYSDYNSAEEVQAAGDALNEQIGEEGFVLLKNANDTLPLLGAKRVSVFGRNANNHVRGGSGSGGAGSTNVRSIYESLEEAGLSYNPQLRALYDSSAMPAARSNSRTGEAPVSVYTRSITESFSLYNDAAIIVISRLGFEGADYAYLDTETGGPEDNTDPTKHYLELGDNESEMLEMVKDYFDKVIVVLNSASPMEIGSLQDDPEVDGIIWIGTTGSSSIMALGRILTGEVNPSGRTVDIYTRDFTTDPVYQNFGNNRQTGSSYYFQNEEGNNFDYTSPGPTSGQGIRGIMYEEGIYLGYRYYETVAADLGTDAGEAWYNANVVYPYGYGLSYTSFAQEIVASDPADGAQLTKDGHITVDVRVTNTGNYAGKEVVQLYYTAPYTTGGIEKAHVVLAAFAKTDLLAPGASQTVRLELDVQDMASYDYTDKNENGHYAYELEAGDYALKIMKNSHEVLDTIEYEVAGEGFQYDTDKVTGYTVENRFTGVSSVNPDYERPDGAYLNEYLEDKYNSLPETNDFEMTVMSRADFEGTFPETPDEAALRVKEGSTFEKTIDRVFTIGEYNENDPWWKTADDARYTDENGNLANFTQADEDIADADREVPYQLYDLAGADYDDPRWETLLNSLKLSEIETLIGHGGYRTQPLEIIGKPRATDSDGPANLAGIGWAGEPVIAATYNTELAEQMGQIVGNESLWQGVQGWYAPAMNLHRSPFSGRNFEYYSEDPYLSGKMAAATVRGAQSKGLYVYIKHFALNDQESDRYDLVTYCDEQAMRELYLKPFQIAVQEGNASGVMSAFNRVGRMPCESNYMLLTEILRNEWGFEGAVVTDYYVCGYTAHWQNPNALYAAGGSIPLVGMGAAADLEGEWSPEENCLVYTDSDGVSHNSYTQWIAMRNAAKDILYVAANSNEMRNGLTVTSAVKDDAGQTTTQLKEVYQNDSSVSVALVDADSIGTEDYTVSVSGGAIPDGMSVSAAGVLSGAATEAGDFTFTVTVVADGWVGGELTYTMTVLPSVTLNGDAADSLQVGKTFSAQLISELFVVNPDFNTQDSPSYHTGYSSISYSVRDDSLPAGLEFDADTLTISGTPTEAGTFTTTMRVTYGYWSAGGWGGGSVRNANVDFTITFVITGEGGTEPGYVENVPYIGENGNWWINGADTGVNASGIQGPQGPQGPQGEPGAPGESGCNSSLDTSAIVIAVAAIVVAAGAIALCRVKSKKNSGN